MVFKNYVISLFPVTDWINYLVFNSCWIQSYVLGWDGLMNDEMISADEIKFLKYFFFCIHRTEKLNKLKIGFITLLPFPLTRFFLKN